MERPPPGTLKISSLGIIIAALGVVYGDIGTSPLYAFRICFDGTGALPANDNAAKKQTPVGKVMTYESRERAKFPAGRPRSANRMSYPAKNRDAEI